MLSELSSQMDPPWETRPVTQPPSPVFFSKIKSWLEECEAGGRSGHRMCLPDDASQSRPPTRLLRIVQEQGEFKVCLRESNGDTTRYATLSHCWGGYQPLRTTKENLNDHVKEIKWSSLPRTFQDSVMISHGLGIGYLWIDSLCIIQDDEEDWTKEAARMKDIYAGSYVTLAATAGKDSRHDLFPRVLQDEPGVENGDIRRCARYSVWYTSALTTRAWVMQERLLSRRTLYFYEDEVMLECPSTLRCQCGGSNSVSMTGYQTYALTFGDTRTAADNDSILCRFTQARRHMSNSSGDQQHLGRQDLVFEHPLSVEGVIAITMIWDELLEQYCQQKITKLGDRLPAFSGIAETFGNNDVFGDYTAGLWAKLLLPLSLWYIDSGKSPNIEKPSESDQALAPSWSWASIRGAWCYRRFRFRTENFAVATHYLSDPPEQDQQHFGAVKKGVVTIEGHIGIATIQYNALCSDCQNDPDMTYAEKFKAQKVELIAGGESIEMWPDFVLLAVQNPVVSGEEVYCLPIQGDSEIGHRIMQGLVLRVDEGDPTLFCRIGVFQSPVWFGSMDVEEVRIC